MLRPLHIFLTGEQTTRRDYRRVVSLYCAVLLGICAAIVVFRVPFILSPTLRYQPENVAVSIHVLATPSNVRLLAEHFADLSIAQGAPWTLTDIIAHSKKEFSLHADATGNIGFAVDTQLAAEEIAMLASYGYAASAANGMTTVFPAGTTLTDTGRHANLHALLPTYDGDVFVHEASAQRIPLKINNQGLTLAGAGVAVDTATNPNVAEGSRVLAQLSLPAGELSFPALAESLLPIPATSRAMETLLRLGGSLLMTSDGEGIGYFLSFPPGDLTVEELASLGKDIMNRQSLTTQEWTSDDGEAFQEIRSDTDAITTDIRAEEEFTFITLTNADGDTLRLARTPSLLTLANREILLENSEKVRSSCLYHAHTWLLPEILTGNTATILNTNRTTILLLPRFTEIAIGSRNIRLCW